MPLCDAGSSVSLRESPLCCSGMAVALCGAESGSPSSPWRALSALSLLLRFGAQPLGSLLTLFFLCVPQVISPTLLLPWSSSPSVMRAP